MTRNIHFWKNTDMETTEEQFLSLIENNKKLILKVSSAYVRNQEDKKDLIQEIILQLWKAYPDFDDTYAMSTWMYRIALNVSISYLRKEGTRNKIHSNYGQYIEIYNDNDEDEKLKKLYILINQLKRMDKAIIILKLEGLGNNEIADVMGISITNVSTKINRIKNTLSTQFK